MGGIESDDGRAAEEARLRAELDLATRLHEQAATFLGDGDLSRLLDAALLEALALAGTDRGCVQILHGGGGGLRLAAQRGLVRPFLEYVANLRTGLGGHGAAPDTRSWLVDDVADDEALAGGDDREALLGARVRALHVTPLRAADGRVIGRLAALHRAAPEPRPATLAGLERVAALCAAAVAHAQAAAPRVAPGSDAALAARLRATEELFSNTVENLPVSMLLCDREGRVLYVDPALGELVRAVCGLGPRELVGKPGAEIWPPLVWGPLEAQMRRAVATGRRQSYDIAFPVPSGAVNHRHWVVVPIAGPDGAVDRVLGISHDVTEQRRLFDEVREADRRKSEFIGLLSHELRNPLSAIRSSLYVLERDDDPGRERRSEARGVIDRQVRHLVRLVDDLLDTTRLSQNKVQLRRQALDLARVVREAIEDNRAHVEACGVRLEARLPDRPVRASVDAVRIAQVVTNLLSNAAKFTPPGGSARVALGEEGDVAVLEVSDTGCGIEAPFLPRLFEPFVQAERALDGAGGGLGLGLALVRGLVELHGGEVAARSDGSGRGATFVVRLPLDATADGPGDEPARSGAPRRRRVLVIDDDRDVANGLKLALEVDAHEVAVAYDGAAGLTAARAFAPDVVLCDIGMPDMDGYDVARAFRADVCLAGVFLVALTGYAQAADRDKARAAGFDEHLAKPANMARIHALLAR
jgi:two-component system CheB/CheR fusion protein